MLQISINHVKGYASVHEYLIVNCREYSDTNINISAKIVKGINFVTYIHFTLTLVYKHAYANSLVATHTNRTLSVINIVPVVLQQT